MKLEVQNVNYCATVIRIHNLVELQGLDNLRGVPAFGYQALVPKTTEVGQLAVLFVAESQLDEAYCSNNNLFRHSDLNLDKTLTGYIEDSRRVKAVKFRGHTSSALVMPLASLAYLLIDTNELKEGDTFTHINGKEVCRKYVGKQNQVGSKTKQGQSKKISRIDAKLIPEHIDTSHYLRNEHLINDDVIVIVTQKLHGTSARFAYQVCDKPLTRLEKILKWLGFKVQETEYDYFACSRRVIKDIKRTGLEHFYDMDIWNQHLENIKGVIPKNWVLYGEIVGWVGEKAVQPNYTYGVDKGKSELYIYRIAIVNTDGLMVDLSWDQVVWFCKNNGLKYTPELWRGQKKDFDPSVYMDRKFKDTGLDAVELDKGSPCDEGVCIRVEGLVPFILKAKSPLFMVHETKQIDTGNVDIESVETDV